jgi:type IX secretion system PorP/SprF family membrane protein
MKIGVVYKPYSLNMKKLLSILLLSAVATSLVAQSNMQLNNFWENTYFISPASINEKYNTELALAARQLWAGNEGAASTAFGSATIYNEDMRSQFGVKVIGDHIGYTTRFDGLLSYAYSLFLTKDVHLHMGIGLGYQFLTFDISQVQVSNPSDPVPYMRLTDRSNFNSDFGMELYTKNLRVGFSGQHLFSTLNLVDSLLGNSTFYAYINYKEDMKKYINMSYGACLIDNHGRYTDHSGTHDRDVYQLHLTSSAYFKVTPTAPVFNLGLYTRLPINYAGTKYIPEIGGLFGIEIGDNTYLTYSVDFNMSNINRNSIGTHELMLTYKINPRRKCRTCSF